MFGSTLGGVENGKAPQSAPATKSSDLRFNKRAVKQRSELARPAQGVGVNLGFRGSPDSPRGNEEEPKKRE